MKALTICQPYPRLIMIGEKRVENREWSTRYRGPLLIHAGKSRAWLSPTNEAEAIKAGDPLVFGAVVCQVDLIHVLHISAIQNGAFDSKFSQLPWLREHRHAHGPWCWILDNVRRFDTPYACSGKQGLWDFDETLLGESHA